MCSFSATFFASPLHHPFSEKMCAFQDETCFTFPLKSGFRQDRTNASSPPLSPYCHLRHHFFLPCLFRRSACRRQDCFRLPHGGFACELHAGQRSVCRGRRLYRHFCNRQHAFRNGDDERGAGAGIGFSVAKGQYLPALVAYWWKEGTVQLCSCSSIRNCHHKIG